MERGWRGDLAHAEELRHGHAPQIHTSQAVYTKAISAAARAAKDAEKRRKQSEKQAADEVTFPSLGQSYTRIFWK